MDKKNHSSQRVKSLLKGTLFSPLSFLWHITYKLRRSAYHYKVFHQHVFKIPVISVGNLSFGGTGKTPTIIWLTDWLNEKGLVPVVLTRGYKGQLESSSGLLKSGQKFRLNPFEYGDEPLMIANKMKNGSVIVGKKRAKNLLKYFSEISPDVVLLDDGFQHLQIYRHFNIVLFDATMPLNLYSVAPIGYLRESLSSLKDADAVIISRSDMINKETMSQLTSLIQKHLNHSVVLAKTRYHALGVFDLEDQYCFDMKELKGKKVIAVTAIASPESFYTYLETFGVQIVEKASFPDHYFFSLKDVENLFKKIKDQNIIILCSEKDMVKMKRVTLDRRISFIKVKVEFISGEQELIRELSKVLQLDSSQ